MVDVYVVRQKTSARRASNNKLPLKRYTKFTFKTEGEAVAFEKGLDTAYGYDEPYWTRKPKYNK